MSYLASAAVGWIAYAFLALPRLQPAMPLSDRCKGLSYHLCTIASLTHASQHLACPVCLLGRLLLVSRGPQVGSQACKKHRVPGIPAACTRSARGPDSGVWSCCTRAARYVNNSRPCTEPSAWPSLGRHAASHAQYVSLIKVDNWLLCTARFGAGHRQLVCL